MEQNFVAPKPSKGDPWYVLVVGSGPSAFTAAIYTTRGAVSTLIIAGEKWGGQLMDTSMVDNFPGFENGVMGVDLMTSMRKQAERFGAEIIEKNAVEVDFEKKPFEVKTSDGNIHRALSIIVATGAKTLWLGVPGENKLIGRGVSTCAPCDAPFFKDKKVAVVGGGDSAMEEAYVLTKYASEVYLIHRRDMFKATEAMQKKVLENPKIKILYNTEVVEVLGDAKLTSLKLKNNKDQTIKDEAFDGLFVAIGHKPDSDIFRGKIKMDEAGFIIPDFHCHTSVKGVFACGDVIDKDFKQAVVSAGSGCIAGMEALSYLDGLKTS